MAAELNGRPVPSLRLEPGREAGVAEGRQAVLCPVRVARYSVPSRLIGHQVTIMATNTTITVVGPVTGEVPAEHRLVAPGETSVRASLIWPHYGGRIPGVVASVLVR